MRIEQLRNYRTRLLRSRRWYRLEKYSRKRYELVLQVMTANKAVKVTSTLLKKLLEPILEAIYDLLPEFRGRKVFQKMLEDRKYGWAKFTLIGWMNNEVYCLTAGLHGLGMIE
jgi:transposase